MATQVLNPEIFLDFYVSPASNHTILARAAFYLSGLFSVSYVLKYIIYLKGHATKLERGLDDFLVAFKMNVCGTVIVFVTFVFLPSRHRGLDSQTFWRPFNFLKSEGR